MDRKLAAILSADVQGAVAIQKELKRRNVELPESRQMHYRIGINVGDVVVEGERIYGDGVNIAARIESLAEGGGIAISEAVHVQVENKLDLLFSYQGEQTVKNIAKPVRVYKVELDAEAGVVPVGKEPAALPLPDKPSIAVLPFTNMSNDPEQEYFSDGMTDDIITDLSKISGLFIIARNSTFTYKGQAVNIAEVGQQLGVRHVLEGSVRKAGNRVRINVQLINAPTGGHIWAERYDRELTDIFALQDEIRQKVVFALKVTLAPGKQARFRQAPTTNLDAYDVCLQGQSYLWRGTQAENAQARGFFTRALELDPTYAAANAFLGWTYLHAWFWQWEYTPATITRALELGQRAVTLDETLAQAHSLLSSVHLWKSRAFEEAIAAGQRAISLAPNNADGYALLGLVFCFAGQPQDALHLAEQAVRLDPYYPELYLQLIGHANRLVGHYEESIAAYQRLLVRNPHFPPAHLGLIAGYSEAGRAEEAQAEAAALLQASPTFTVEGARQTLPYEDEAVLERYVAALRQAGLE